MSGLANRSRTVVFERLTEAGRNLAEVSRRRHVLVRDVLMPRGVDAELAEADTEGIEHHVSKQILAAIANFLGCF